MRVFCIIIDSITLLSIATHYSNCYREVIDVTIVSCDNPVFRVAFNTAFMSENQLLLSELKMMLLCCGCAGVDAM